MEWAKPTYVSGRLGQMAYKRLLVSPGCPAILR